MTVRWTRQALRDLDQLRDYTFRYSRRGAEKLVAKIDRSLQLLASHPEMGRLGRIEGTRELIVPRTPYIVVYQLAADQIRLLAIIHSARRWPTEL